MLDQFIKGSEVTDAEDDDDIYSRYQEMASRANEVPVKPNMSGL